MKILTLDVNILRIYKKAIKLCQCNYVISECKQKNYYYFAEQNIESIEQNIFGTRFLVKPKDLPN